MIVVSHHAAVHMHAETVGERIETAGVFGCDDVSALQQRNEACGCVGSIADRRGRQHDRALRNVGSAHESVKSRIAVCVFIFTFALVFAFALIHAFHAFSLSNAKENERPPTFCCPKNGRQSFENLPFFNRAATKAKSPSRATQPPKTSRQKKQTPTAVDTLRLFVQICHPSDVTRRCIRGALVG